mgnify:CR=1 FL=1
MIIEYNFLTIVFNSGKKLALTTAEFEELKQYFEKFVYLPYPNPAPYYPEPIITCRGTNYNYSKESDNEK